MGDPLECLATPGDNDGTIQQVIAPAPGCQGVLPAAVDKCEEARVEAIQQGGNECIALELTAALAYLSQLLLYFLPNIGLAFQYFNLVELKESKGLLSEIDTLGQVKPRSTEEDQY